jgi:hypothetical protein
MGKNALLAPKRRKGGLFKPPLKNRVYSAKNCGKKTSIYEI